MMTDVFTELMEQESEIVIDEKMLRPSYVPNKIIGRDEQISEVVPTLKVVTRNQVPRHIFLLGPNGTGKTVTIRYILRRLHDYADFREFYIFGSNTISAYAVLKEIAEESGGLTTNKDIAMHEMRQRVQDMITAAKTPIIIVLDECDYFKPNVFEDVLQALIGDDRSDAPHVCVVSIANSVRIISGIQDAKVVSRYIPRHVEFPPYLSGELLEILRGRVDAFQPGAIDIGALAECAKLASKNRNGDARYALDLLSEAADLARRNGEKVVVTKCVHKAEEKLEIDYSLRPVEMLGEKMREVFLVIAHEPEQRIKDVFDTYKESAERHGLKPVKSSTFGMYLNGLERRGLIERERRGKEKGRGVDWFVWVSQDLNREEILKVYEVK